MKRTFWISMVLFLVLVGCASTKHKGIKPIYPEVGHPNMPTIVESLQPTLKWLPVPERGVTYDVIVHECIKEEDFLKGPKRTVGREVYYRQGLEATEHKIEEPLRPDSEYFWSVRFRHGQYASFWSVYDYDIFAGTAYMWAKNLPFLFKTPVAKK